MKKIMLVTWLGNGNFGTSLQSYALSKKLNMIGYDCRFLNFFSFDGSAKNRIKNICRYLHIIDAIKFIRSFKSKKDRKVHKFNIENYKQVTISTPRQYKKLLKTADIFLTGSDQIWNTHHRYDPFCFLNFAGTNKRVAYASSIGATSVSAKYKPLVKSHLLNFEHIGVREQTAVDVLNKLTGRNDIIQVLDPTFLLNKGDWQEIADKAVIEIDLPKKYILCYCVGAREVYQQQLDTVKEILGIQDVIFLPSHENPNFILNNTTVYSNAAPAEFIKLLQGAEYVCTDSFHASALSINLSTNFVTLLRFNNDDKGSQNSRIFDLLTHYNLLNRLFSEDSKTWSTSIDYAPIQQVLEDDRENSLKFLVNAIES